MIDSLLWQNEAKQNKAKQNKASAGSNARSNAQDGVDSNSNIFLDTHHHVFLWVRLIGPSNSRGARLANIVKSGFRLQQSGRRQTNRMFWIFPVRKPDTV
jgi:hypothetical protein